MSQDNGNHQTAVQRLVEARRQMTIRQQIVTVMVGISVLTSLIIAGCGGGGTGVAQPGGGGGTATYRVPFIAANDVQYIDAMVPHHQMALEMAEMEIEKGTRAPVKEMARRMKAMQEEEIRMLREARRALTGNADSPMVNDPHMTADMAQLRAATGAAVDARFIQHMIPHHAEAISIAHRALPNLRRADVVQNAKNVIRDQAVEIGQLQAMRTDNNY